MSKPRKTNLTNCMDIEILGGHNADGTLKLSGWTKGGVQHDLSFVIDIYDLGIIAKKIREFMTEHESGFKNRQRLLRESMGYSTTVAEITYKAPQT